MNYTSFRRAGFTVIELVTVVTIIGILTAVTVVGYRTYREDSNIAMMKRDMADINMALEKYYAKNGAYPTTSGAWRYRRQSGESFIPGLIPDYIRTVGDVPFGNTASATANTYIYRSNGFDYKLLRLSEGASVSFQPFEIAAIEPELQDPGPPSSPRWGATVKRGWGYWSPGGKDW